MENPYKGLESYREYNKGNFYGRDDDIHKFSGIVFNNVLTILTGKSGLGKTSLLYAGVFPKLREKRILPVAIRIDLQSGIDRMIYDIHQEIINQSTQYKNQGYKIFLLPKGTEYELQPELTGFYNEDHSKISYRDDTAEKYWQPESLTEYFQKILIRDKNENLWTPCLVLDQFEGIFTGKTNQVLLQNLQKQLIYFIDKVNKENSDSISGIVSAGEPDYKLIISLREDYFAQLTEFLKGIHFKQHAYYLLNPLNGEQANEVIKGPGVLGEEDRKRILQFFYDNYSSRDNGNLSLEDIEIEPTILSLLCTQTFDILQHRTVSKRNNQIQVKLSSELNQEKILKDHFIRLLSGFSAEAQSFIEDHLITKSGYRTPFRLERNLGIKEELHKMEQKRLIKKIWIGGKEHIELIHDVVAPIVRDNRDYRRDEMDKRALEAKLEKEREQRETLQIQQAWTLFISVSAVIIFTVLLILMFRAKEQANNERAIAEEAREFADNQALMAKLAGDSAEIRRQQAEEALILANKQRNAALEARNAALEARKAEFEAKNSALESEEKAKRRKLTADELAYKEKKATIQSQILNKETYAQQLFSRSESLAKGSLTEKEYERKKNNSLASFYAVLSAIKNMEQAKWIDSVFNTIVLPDVESNHRSDSTRFQMLQHFQINYTRFLQIDNSDLKTRKFTDETIKRIYNEHSYIYEALLSTYVYTGFSGNQLTRQLDKSITAFNQINPWKTISSPVYFDISHTGTKVDDIYLTGITYHKNETAFTASAGRILIKNKEKMEFLPYKNDGNSVLAMNFLDNNKLILGKIRSKTRILILNNYFLSSEIILNDKGNVISFVPVETGQLFTLDETGGFWHWDISQVDQMILPEKVYYKKFTFPAQVTDMALNRQTNTFVIGCSNGQVFLFHYDFEHNRIEEENMIEYQLYDNQPVLNLAFNKSGSWMASSTYGTVDIWSTSYNIMPLNGINIFNKSDSRIDGLVFDDRNQFLIFSWKDKIYSRPVDLELIVDTFEQAN